MKRLLRSLSFKIGSIIVLVEIIMLTALGIYYVNQFTNQVDIRLESQVQLPGILMDAGLLSFDSVSDPSIMLKLVGDQLISGMVVGINGNVFYSLNPENLGKSVFEIPNVDSALFNAENLEGVVIKYPDKLISVSPIFGSDKRTPRFIVYTEIQVLESEVEKTNLTRLFFIGSLITILITSFTIYITFKKMILNPIQLLSKSLKIVANGDLKIRVHEKKHLDTLGLLQQSTNLMIENLDENQIHITHLNRVLRSIRNINQLITKERDQDTLLKVACEYLTDKDNYAATWILLIDKEKSPLNFYRRDMHGELMNTQDLDTDSKLMPCIQTTMASNQIEFITNNSEDCKNCSLYNRCSNLFDVVVIPLEFEGNIYGFLNIAFLAEFTVDQDEVSLLKEVAGDISFALFSFELEEKQNRAEVEKEKLENQLFQSQKMDAIGQLAGGIAHDFNNMLSGIISASDLLLLPIRNLDEKSMEYVSIISNASMRAAELTTQLLFLSRKTTTTLCNVDVNSVITEARALLSNTIDKKIDIETRLNAKCSVICGDHSELENGLINLGINASHAMKNGGVITIETNNITFDEVYCNASTFNLSPGDFVEISVRDTGSGMNQKLITQIFEPFFTTKKQGTGTGLGLASVYSMVQKYHGAIHVDSEVGIGSIFHIYIPTVIEKTNLQFDIKNEIVKGSGKIFLIDDEESLRFLGKSQLQDIGYDVTVFKNGFDAINEFKIVHSEIDLIITDMIMPIINGNEVFLKLREIDKTCKVILTSGFIKENELSIMKKNGLSGFLQKPYKINELSRLVSTILNQ